MFPWPMVLSTIAIPGRWRIRNVTQRILNMILSAIRGKIVTQIGLAGQGQDNQPQPRLNSHPPLSTMNVKRTSIEVPTTSIHIWSIIILLSSYRNRPANEALLPCGPLQATEDGNWPHASHGQVFAKTSCFSIKILYEICHRFLVPQL